MVLYGCQGVRLVQFRSIWFLVCIALCEEKQPPYWKTREDLFAALMKREKAELADDLKQRIAADLAGATLRGLLKHSALALMQRPLLKAVLLPFFRECSHMLEAGARRDGTAVVWVRRELRKLVGETDANALLSGLHDRAHDLASLRP